MQLAGSGRSISGPMQITGEININRRRYSLHASACTNSHNSKYRCLHGTAPLYLMNSCTQQPTSSCCQHLRSASQRKMIVPRYRMDSYGRRCFAVVGPSTWNSLPDRLRDPALSLNISRRQIKTRIFAKYRPDVTRRIRECFYDNALYKLTLLPTYLLTC